MNTIKIQFWEKRESERRTMMMPFGKTNTWHNFDCPIALIPSVGDYITLAYEGKEYPVKVTNVETMFCYIDSDMKLIVTVERL